MHTLKAYPADAGYGGDVWPREPAPHDHMWRYMKHNAMTPHMAALTTEAQVRSPTIFSLS